MRRWRAICSGRFWPSINSMWWTGRPYASGSRESPIEPVMRTMSWKGIINRYRAFLPVTDRTPIVTLNEGNTPLVRAERLQSALGIEAEVYLKYEGLNPTGSFKDRGMTLAISKAVEEGARAAICAPTRHTTASA